MRFLYKLPVLLILVASTFQLAQAQCSSCTYTVSSNSNSNYSLNSGQTLCISSGVIFTGNIDLNGGTLCNSGTINGGNVNFNSGKIYNNGIFRKSGMSVNGEFYNYGTADINGDLNINGNGIFYNYAGAQLSVSSSLNNNHIFVNNGSVTVNGSYAANNGNGNLNQNTGTIAIGGAFHVNKPVSNSGTITVGGSMFVNNNGSFDNAVGASLTVSGQYQNNSTTVNNGTIIINNGFTNNSNGSFANNMTTNVIGNFTNNGPIIGDAVGCNSFTVNGSSIVQNSHGSISNNDFCTSGTSGFFTTNNGSLNNVTYCTCTNSGITPLPIVLKSFTAKCVGDGVEFTWVTATELNNDYFTIYQSADLETWEPIQNIPGNGNSNGDIEYSYEHSRSNGVSYYRLQQTDFDGTSKSFAPISISCEDVENAEGILVFPNPVDEEFSIKINMDKTQTVSIEIFEISGRKISTKTMSVPQGTTILPAERNGLGAGPYLLRVISNGEVIGLQKIVFK